MDVDSISEAEWRLTQATVTGKAHVDQGLRNQDWVETQTSPDGRVVAAVVSDGAGTASHSHLGSRTTCELMAPWMRHIGHDLLRAPSMDESMVFDRVAEGIESVRRVLGESDEVLRRHHCTFVACVLTPRASYVCQVGDSVAVSSRFDEADEPAPARVDFFPDHATQVFVVERGEYANETHFITEPDWRSHLRIRPLAIPADAVLLMTDGAMDVAMVRGSVFRGFLSNLVGKLLAIANRDEREATLREWLADRRTHPVTGDDKTMFVALRASRQAVAGRPIVVDDHAPQLTTVQAAEAAPPLRRESNATAPVAVASLPRPWYWRSVAWITGVSVILLGALAGAGYTYRSPITTTFAFWQDRLVPPSQPRRPQAARPTPLTTPMPVSASRDPAPPPPAEPSPAELVLAAQRPLELVIKPGESADIMVSLVGAGDIRLVSVHVPPELKSREVAVGSACSQDDKLTKAASTCIIRVEVPKKLRPAIRQLTVEFRDLKTGKDRKVILPVRIVAASAP